MEAVCLERLVKLQRNDLTANRNHLDRGARNRHEITGTESN